MTSNAGDDKSIIFTELSKRKGMSPNSSSSFFQLD